MRLTYFFWTKELIEDFSEDRFQTCRDDIEGNTIVDAKFVERLEVRIDVQRGLHGFKAIFKRNLRVHVSTAATLLTDGLTLREPHISSDTSLKDLSPLLICWSKISRLSTPHPWLSKSTWPVSCMNMVPSKSGLTCQ